VANPNPCELCKHHTHPDGGWCYLFRNEPTEWCGQFALKPIAIIYPDLDMAECEALYHAWRLAWPKLAAEAETLAHGCSIIDMKMNEALKAFAVDAPTVRKPAERPKVRKSAKTGATWPKPKGSY
jgi:hypothetical protein